MTMKLLNLKSVFSLLLLFVLFWFAPENYLFSEVTPPQNKLQTTPKTNSATPLRAPTVPAGKGFQIAAPESSVEITPPKTPSLITQGLSLTLLSLAPFIIMILTSFLKIVVVLSLLRSALGVQQAPPNQIINGVAFMLSLFIMYPTAVEMYTASQDAINRIKIPNSVMAPEASTYILEIATHAQEPLREFLKRNCSIKHRELFFRIAHRGLSEEYRAKLKIDDFIVLVPSYITSQLKEAFEIGVLIYIPFFVIDLVTSNILLAMGMMMLSPVTISMPLKLFLLVMLDGWTLLIQGLVSTFR